MKQRRNDDPSRCRDIMRMPPALALSQVPVLSSSVALHEVAASCSKKARLSEEGLTSCANGGKARPSEEELTSCANGGNGGSPATSAPLPKAGVPTAAFSACFTCSGNVFTSSTILPRLPDPWSAEGCQSDTSQEGRSLVPCDVGTPSGAYWTSAHDALLVRWAVEEPRVTCAAFDLDETLLRWTSANFPSKLDHYALWSSAVVPAMRRWHAQGRKLVILSNQAHSPLPLIQPDPI